MKLSWERRTDAYYAVDFDDARISLGGPSGRRHETWQAAYAEAKDWLAISPAGCQVDVMRRTYDACIYRGLARWVANGDGSYRRII